MNASLKILFEESAKLERLVNIKITLLKLPVNILSTKEIREIKKIFEDFTTRLERLSNSFMEIKEQKASQNRKMDEAERIIENQFNEIKRKDEEIKEKIDYLNFEFDKIHNEELNFLRRNKRFTQRYDDNSDDSGSERSDAGEHESLIINKIFLNSIVTTNQVSQLQSKQTLEEERAYVMEIFNLKDLFPSSISKQLILVDFYMNIYNFCIKSKFTIEQISTVFSIFYVLFSYSFINSKIVLEKSQSLFNDKLDFHSLNRPPFSYEIFTQEQKGKLSEFGKTTFFHLNSSFQMFNMFL